MDVSNGIIHSLSLFLPSSCQLSRRISLLRWYKDPPGRAKSHCSYCILFHCTSVHCRVYMCILHTASLAPAVVVVSENTLSSLPHGEMANSLPCVLCGRAISTRFVSHLAWLCFFLPSQVKVTWNTHSPHSRMRQRDTVPCKLQSHFCLPVVSSFLKKGQNPDGCFF